MDDTNTLRLERRDPARNMMRFYVLQVAPNLFGEWCLLRMWGRIGRGGQTRLECFETKQKAEDTLRTLETSKRKRRYREKQSFPFGGEVRRLGAAEKSECKIM